MAKEIPQDKLEQGHWYFGEGRIGPIAKWDGKYFIGLGYSWSQWHADRMDYGARGFSPYVDLNSAEARAALAKLAHG